MKHIVRLLPIFLTLAASALADPQVTLSHLRGRVYVVEDSYYAAENSAVYIGPKSVTVVGATWTPQTAKRLLDEIRKVTNEPLGDVIDTDYNPERAGGNEYWKSIGARIVSTRLTYKLLQTDWTKVCSFVRHYYPDYPQVELALPTVAYPGNFSLQNGHLRALYLGPSHTADGIFVYFPDEKVLYAGNILKEHLGNLAFADLREYPNTLRRLQQLHLPLTTIIAGHWSALHGPELIDQYLQMLQDNTPRRN